MAYVSEPLRRLIIERASNSCEYCLLPDSLSFYAHEVDHIVALKHQGKTEAENLAYACWRCNRSKGSDLGSFDPQTGDFSFLFNPRKQLWEDHFVLLEGQIFGQSPMGRTTVSLLKMNTAERVMERLLYTDQ